MTDEELYRAMLEHGEDGLFDYFYETISADIGEGDEAEDKADEQLEEYLRDTVQDNKEIAKDIAKIIIEDETETKTVEEWSKDADSGKESVTLLMSIGGKIRTNPAYYEKASIHSSAKPKLIRERVSERLKDEYHLLSDVEMNIPRDFKNRIMNHVLTLMNEKSGEDLRGIGEKNTAQGRDPETIKDTLANFIFDGKKITKPRQIWVGIKPNNIKTARMLDNDDLKAIKAELEDHIDMYGDKPHLFPLLEKIEMLLEDSKVYLVDIDVDTLIGQLDLKYLSRRKAIYKFWEQRHKLQSKGAGGDSATIQEASSKFLASLLAFKQGGKTELPPELDKWITEYEDIHKRMMADDSFSYIVAFNPTEDDLRSKMQISKLQKVDDNALNVLHSFLEKEYPELLEDQEEYERLSDRDYDESFSGLAGQGKGRLDMKDGLRDKETGEKQAPIGEIEFGQSKKRSQEAKELADTISAFRMGVVDPLFLYAFRHGGMFTNTAIFEKEMKLIRNKVIEYSKHGGFIIQDGDPGFRKLDKFLKKIEEELVEVDDKTKYLPLTPTLVNMLEELKITKLNGKSLEDLDNSEEIGQYLQHIRKFKEFGKPLQQAREPSVTNPQEAIGGGSKRLAGGIGVQGGSVGHARDFTNEIEDFEDGYEQLLEVINKYYIIPTKSRYLPFNDKGPRWSTTIYSTKLGAMRSEATADSMAILLTLQLRWGARLVETDWLNGITDILKHVNHQTGDSVDSRDMITHMENLVQLLSAIYAKSGGKSVIHEAKIEVGASLHDILKRNNLETDIEFYGKSTKQWKRIFTEQEDAGGKIYPLEALIYHLFQREGEYTEKENKKIPTDGRRRKAYKEFFDAVRNLEIIKSDIDLKILQGHDVVRKMLGKPVYFRTNKTDDYAQMSNTLDIIEKKFNTDMTLLEIEGIVDDRDSHENVSKRYGVSKEIVYYVKGNFR